MAHTAVTSTILGADPEADELLSELRATGPEGRPATQPQPAPSVGERIGATLRGTFEDVGAALQGKPLPSRERQVQTLKLLQDQYVSFASSGAGPGVLEPVVKNLNRVMRDLDPTLAFSPEAERHLIEAPDQASLFFDEDFLASLSPVRRRIFNATVLKDPERAQGFVLDYLLAEARKEANRLSTQKGLSPYDALSQTLRLNPRYAPLARSLKIAAPPELAPGKLLDVAESCRTFALGEGYGVEEAEQFVRTGVLPSGPTPKAGQAAQSAQALREAREAATAASKVLADVRSGKMPASFNDVSLIIQRLAKTRQGLEFAVGIPEEERQQLIQQIEAGIAAAGGMLAEIGKRRQVPTKPEGTFESLPAPAKYKGQTIVNEDTGEEWKSDGKKWVPVKPAKGRR